jgi:hypothetical protein
VLAGKLREQRRCERCVDAAVHQPIVDLVVVAQRDIELEVLACLATFFGDNRQVLRNSSTGSTGWCAS